MTSQKLIKDLTIIIKTSHEIEKRWKKQKAIKTPEELKAYFASEKLTCLICEKEYYSLSIHLLRTHKMNSDSYRKLFNIPSTYSLQKPKHLPGKRGSNYKTLKRKQLNLIPAICSYCDKIILKPEPTFISTRNQGRHHYCRPPKDCAKKGCRKSYSTRKRNKELYRPSPMAKRIFAKSGKNNIKKAQKALTIRRLHLVPDICEECGKIFLRDETTFLRIHFKTGNHFCRPQHGTRHRDRLKRQQQNAKATQN